MKKLTISLFLLFLAVSIKTNAQVSFQRNQFISLGDYLWTAMVDTADIDNDGRIEILAMCLKGDSMNLSITHVFEGMSVSNIIVLKRESNINNAVRNFTTLNANTDQRKDIAYIHKDSVTILYQDKDGNFSLDSSMTMYSGATTDGIAKGDFNKDGKDDFVTTNWNDDHLTLFTQASACVFDTLHIPAVQAGYNQIKVVDFDGDGWQDIVFLAGQLMQSGVYVYINDKGSFHTEPIYMYITNQNSGEITITQSVSFGNFFGTGMKCLLSTSAVYNTPNSKFFTTTGIKEREFGITEFGRSSATADLNGDGKDELIVLTNTSPENLMVIEFKPFPVVYPFIEQISGNYHSLDQAVVCADVLGNSGLDIITISDWGGITIWENTSITTGTQNTALPMPNTLSIFPTMFDAMVTVGTNTPCDIMIYDINGRSMYAESIEKGISTIDLSELPTGMYIIKSSHGATKKIIKQ